MFLQHSWCSSAILSSKESFSFAVKSLREHRAILYHSHMVGRNRNSISRPTCFELPSPAQLFFLCSYLEASSNRKIQTVRGSGEVSTHKPYRQPRGDSSGYLYTLYLLPLAQGLREGEEKSSFAIAGKQ